MIPTCRKLVIVSLIFVSCITACAKKTELDKIKAVITHVQKSAEKRDTKGVLSHLSKAYRDPAGHDYDGIRAILVYYFFTHQTVSVIVTGLEADVSEGNASARFEAILAGRSGSETGVIPEALGAYRFDVSLLKEGDAWLIKSAKWEQIGESTIKQSRALASPGSRRWKALSRDRKNQSVASKQFREVALL